MRWRLRATTAEAHARVDAALGGLPMETLAGYAAFLRAVASATMPLERAMDALGIETDLPGWKARRCAPNLADDLAGLGAAPVAITLPRCPQGTGVALGMAYVLEGSRLGSRLMLGRVIAGGDPILAANTRHLRRCEDLAAWRGILGRIEGLVGDAAAEDGALRGASYAFEAFERACPVAGPVAA